MDQIFITHTQNQTGRHHKHHGIETQDRCLAYVDPTGTYMVIATADGAGGCGNPCEAAEANLDAAKVIADNGDFYSALSEKKFRQRVSTLFFEKLTDTGKPMQNLNATVGLVLLNCKTLDYVAFNVGDTRIYAVTTDLTVLEMIHPLNGLNDNETLFTHNITLTRKYGAYKKGNLTGKLTGFITLSDGAGSIIATDYSQLCAGMLLSDKAAAETDARIIAKASQMTSDDISYAIAMLQNDQTVSAAKALYNFLPAEAAEPETSAPAAEEPEYPAVPARQLDAPDTIRTLPEPVPIPALPPLPALDVTLPPLLTFLTKPRTAAEMIESNLGFDRDKTMFIAEIAVLIRLDLITCTEDSDGKIRFRTCFPTSKTGA